MLVDLEYQHDQTLGASLNVLNVLSHDNANNKSMLNMVNMVNGLKRRTPGCTTTMFSSQVVPGGQQRCTSVYSCHHTDLLCSLLNMVNEIEPRTPAFAQVLPGGHLRCPKWHVAKIYDWEIEPWLSFLLQNGPRWSSGHTLHTPGSLGAKPTK